MAQQILYGKDWDDVFMSRRAKWKATEDSHEHPIVPAILKWDDAISPHSFVAYEIMYDHRIESLDDKIGKLEKRVAELNSIIEKLPGEIVIRNITYEQAKKEIVKYFSDHHGKNLDAADIQRALKIDISLALEVCDELEKEEKIKSV